MVDIFGAGCNCASGGSRHSFEGPCKWDGCSAQSIGPRPSSRAGARRLLSPQPGVQAANDERSSRSMKTRLNSTREPHGFFRLCGRSCDAISHPASSWPIESDRHTAPKRSTHHWFPSRDASPDGCPQCHGSHSGLSGASSPGGTTVAADPGCVHSCLLAYSVEVALCGRFPTPQTWAACVTSATGSLAFCLALCALAKLGSGNRPNPKTSLCFLGTCHLKRFEDAKSDIFEPRPLCFRTCIYGCGAGLESEVVIPPLRTWPTCVPGVCPPTAIQCMHYDMANPGVTGMGCPPEAPAWMPPGGGPGNAYQPPNVPSYPPAGGCNRSNPIF